MECEDCGKDYLSGYVYCPFCGQPNLAMKEQAWPQLITKRIEQSWLYADVYKPHRDAIQEWSVFVSYVWPWPYLRSL